MVVSARIKVDVKVAATMLRLLNTITLYPVEIVNVMRCLLTRR